MNRGCDLVASHIHTSCIVYQKILEALVDLGNVGTREESGAHVCRSSVLHGRSRRRRELVARKESASRVGRLEVLLL